jgi:hypothetical protein
MEDHGVDCVLCLLSGYVYKMLLDSLVLVSCHAWVSSIHKLDWEVDCCNL